MPKVRKCACSPKPCESVSRVGNKTAGTSEHLTGELLITAQSAKHLHTQRREDEEQQEEQQTKVANLGKVILRYGVRKLT